jgi:uncharacterized membrane protein YbhN (UPF0104 family)
MRRKILLSLLFGLLVLTALAFAGDAPRVLAALEGFPPPLLPLILVLTLWNYALRFLKWQIYLRRLRISVRPLDSLGVFLCGLSMAVTPGKAGELLKSVLLRRRAGTPVAISAPIVLAERLTDGMAMIGLAATGVLLYRTAIVPLAILLAAFAAVVVISQLPIVRARLLPLVMAHPRLVHQAEAIGRLYASARSLLAPRLLLLGVAIGLISWSGECGAFYLVLVGLGFHTGGTLLIQAAFVLAVSTLIGSATLLPGGLGTAEGSATVLLIAVVHAGTADAVAATLLIRLCTLWFGVAIWLVIFRRRFGLFDAGPLRTAGDGAQQAI